MFAQVVVLSGEVDMWKVDLTKSYIMKVEPS